MWGSKETKEEEEFDKDNNGMGQYVLLGFNLVKTRWTCL